MLKLILISLLTILVTINIALAVELDISLIEYDQETQQARIRISNIGSRNLHDLILSIDGKEKEHKGLLLKPLSQGGGSVVLPRTVESGMHIVTAKTSEGVVVEKELLFPKSKEQVQKEIEEKELGEVEEREEEIIAPETQKTSYTKSIIFLVIFIAVIVALTFMMRFLKKRKNA